MDPRSLIFDWNTRDGGFDWATARVTLDDETLRDGLQSPSIVDPPAEAKLRLLHLMARLGIRAADIGLPGAGERAVEQVRLLTREIATARLPLVPNCAARTLVADIEPIARISQEFGIALEVAMFIGSSGIRQYAEDWTIERMLEVSERAVRFAVAEGLPVMFVTEDTTRARPEALQALYGRAIEWGARRLTLADTTGHATPAGVRALVRFVKEEIIAPSGEPVLLDWHGHRDRGLGIANCLAAVEAGVDQVHATALGIGERVGNAEMDLLLVNLHLLGMHRHDLSALSEYCRVASEATGVPIPPNYPVVGSDAFRTATGVHAAAIIKAKEKGDDWLADLVYSSVPANVVGRRQVIEISPVSGLSNVRYWLQEHGYDASDEACCEALFGAAKTADRVLTEDECHRLVATARRGSGRDADRH